MDQHSFENVIRYAAAGISRRRSLFTLGAAGLASLAHPFTLEAKKKGGKKKKKKQAAPQPLPPPPPSPLDICATQVEPCTVFWTRLCSGGACSGPEQIACCSHLATCDTDGYFVCLAFAQL